MLTDSRISELLDYATNYGEFDENTPNGTEPKQPGDTSTAMNEGRRASILAFKELLERRNAWKNSGKLCIVWNGDKTEAFVTRDAGLAYEARKGAESNCFTRDGKRSFLAEAFCDIYGQEDCSLDIIPDGFVPAQDWLTEPPKGEMFIWARPRDGKWAVGVAYWTTEGKWRDIGGVPSASGDAIRYHRMPTPPEWPL